MSMFFTGIRQELQHRKENISVTIIHLGLIRKHCVALHSNYLIYSLFNVMLALLGPIQILCMQRGEGVSDLSEFVYTSTPPASVSEGFFPPINEDLID